MPNARNSGTTSPLAVRCWAISRRAGFWPDCNWRPQGPNGNSYHARIEGAHEILQGFDDTRILPGAEYRLPVRASGPSFMTVIPPYPGFPPEMVYTNTLRSDEPAVVVREQGASRLVWFPGDLDRSFWRSGDGDLSKLLQQSVSWLLRDEMPVRVGDRGRDGNPHHQLQQPQHAARLGAQDRATRPAATEGGCDGGPAREGGAGAAWRRADPVPPGG